MSIIQDILVQDAVYWKAKTQDENGNYDFELPINIKVRWQDGQIVVPGPENTVTYNGKVYVGIEIPFGSVLLKDSVINDLKGPLPPPDQARRVLRSFEIPDFDAEEFLRWIVF